MSQSVNLKRMHNAILLWTLVNGEEHKGRDEIRDVITYKDGVKIGYFIMVDKSEEILNNYIDNTFRGFNKEYVVFNSEADYMIYRNKMPKSIGMICNDDLYEFGTVVKTMHESKLAN